MVDVVNMKRSVWLLFFSMAFFGLFGPSNLSYYWSVYSVFFIFSFAWALYLIYGCERYVVFLATMVFVGVAIFLFLASSLAYVSVSALPSGGGGISIVAALTPIVLVYGVFYIILCTKSTHFPFECIGNRVTSKRRERSKGGYSFGMVAGVSVLIGGMFLKSVDALTSSAVLIVGCTVFSITILILARHSIRGLRTLRTQERCMPVPYTFMEIDEIREARGRWWVGRLFNWMASSRR
ncbi:hypothetical protein [Pseudomonas sp. PDM31]|uniref:hypothetical protein n=1 Tax=Pseudomonas sp. PDM31 TaxID=2854778 RepID=UPI001C460F6D|nr:hypothetical protein [Pseudomonas sp. PDM31]MBV7477302.1 hypothetical protein [Pseudomonas sp. PDM31]